MSVNARDAMPDGGVLAFTTAVGSIGGRLDPSMHLLEKPFTAHDLLTKTRQLLGVHAE